VAVQVSSNREECAGPPLFLTPCERYGRLPSYCGMKDEIVTPSRAHSRKSLAELNQVDGLAAHLVGSIHVLSGLPINEASQTQ